MQRPPVVTFYPRSLVVSCTRHPAVLLVVRVVHPRPPFVRAYRYLHPWVVRVVRPTVVHPTRALFRRAFNPCSTVVRFRSTRALALCLTAALSFAAQLVPSFTARPAGSSLRSTVSLLTAVHSQDSLPFDDVLRLPIRLVYIRVVVGESGRSADPSRPARRPFHVEPPRRLVEGRPADPHIGVRGVRPTPRVVVRGARLTRADPRVGSCAPIAHI